MRLHWTIALLASALGGCSVSSESQRYAVYFEPYSASLDQHARSTIQVAADFAQTHPALPVAVAGYAAPPDPNQDVDGLSEKRADIVKQALVGAGVGLKRITTTAKGITDPKALPQVAVRRVDIVIGRTDSNDTSAAGGGFK